MCQAGKESGYYWRERYTEKGGHGAEKYCEYPANLIRIVQRFLLGVDFGLDGTLIVAPTAPEEFWNAGFGQTLSWRGRNLPYRMWRDRIVGDYDGEGPQRLCVKLLHPPGKAAVTIRINGRPAEPRLEGDKLVVLLPAAPLGRSCHFEVQQGERIK